MSILSEQINSIKHVGKFLEELRHGPFMKKSDIIIRTKHLLRHYPTNIELDQWHEWLIHGKGHE